jgi:hypothetical protein
MAVVTKKAWPELFQAVLDGNKKFDLRLADVDIKEGDILLLEEYNPETKEYTGRKIEKKANFVMKTRDLKFWTKEEVDKYGYVVIGF